MCALARGTSYRRRGRGRLRRAGRHDRRGRRSLIRGTRLLRARADQCEAEIRKRSWIHKPVARQSPCRNTSMQSGRDIPLICILSPQRPFEITQASTALGTFPTQPELERNSHARQPNNSPRMSPFWPFDGAFARSTVGLRSHGGGQLSNTPRGAIFPVIRT